MARRVRITTLALMYHMMRACSGCFTARVPSQYASVGRAHRGDLGSRSVSSNTTCHTHARCTLQGVSRRVSIVVGCQCYAALCWQVACVYGQAPCWHRRGPQLVNDGFTHAYPHRDRTPHHTQHARPSARPINLTMSVDVGLCVS